ncbi:MAG: 4Fe-4S binding protein [Eubacteriales bacterium]
MKQLLILSGKGGTGKTTIASAFIKLSSTKVYADCDVDAPNLHLIMNHSNDPERRNYYGLPKAEINQETCINCGMCKANCRFDAIELDDNQFNINEYACEGCGVCEYICPVNAITLKPDVAGELMLYKDKSLFSTAKLKMGRGTSGKLVTEVKKQLKTDEITTDIAIIDGSPGIGCPVIASLSGVDMVLIVAEPSLSGISDMERIVKTANSFQTKIGICINKYDTNMDNTRTIEEYCKEMKLPFLGKIPFDTDAVKAINQGKSIVDIDCRAGGVIQEIYKRTTKELLN